MLFEFYHFWKIYGFDLNIPFKKVVLPGRVKCGGTEGEIVVAHGRLPSPARPYRILSY